MVKVYTSVHSVQWCNLILGPEIPKIVSNFDHDNFSADGAGLVNGLRGCPLPPPTGSVSFGDFTSRFSNNSPRPVNSVLESSPHSLLFMCFVHGGDLQPYSFSQLKQVQIGRCINTYM
jgi:hypothetical protein